MAAYFLQISPGEIVSSCYKRYAKTSNPSAYNTNNAADDLDDVRTALGYRKLLLYGGSVPARFSPLSTFAGMRTESESTVLFGIQPPHFESLPGAPDGAQVALDDLVAKCAHEGNCRSHFPQFSANFQAVLGRFRYGPVPMQVLNPKTKRMESVRLSKEVLVDRIRENLYSPDNAAFLPYIIERAYHRDYVPLGLMIDVWSQFLSRHRAGAGYKSRLPFAD